MGACLKPEVPSDNGDMRSSRKGGKKRRSSSKGRRSNGRKSREGNRQRARSASREQQELERELAEQGRPQQEMRPAPQQGGMPPQGPPQQGPPRNQPEPNAEDPNATGQAQAPGPYGQPMNKYGGQGQNGYGQQPAPPQNGYGQQPPNNGMMAQPPAQNGMMAQPPAQNGPQPPEARGQEPEAEEAAQQPAEEEAHSQPANAGHQGPMMKGSPLMKGISPKLGSVDEAAQQWDPSEAVLTIDDPAHAHEVHYGKPMEIVTQPAVVNSRYSFDPPAHYQAHFASNEVDVVTSTYMVDEETTKWERENGITDM